MVKLSDKLCLKEQEIINDVQRNGSQHTEYEIKMLQATGRSKVLSVRLNRQFRILFIRGATNWIHFKTVNRKDLKHEARNI